MKKIKCFNADCEFWETDGKVGTSVIDGRCRKTKIVINAVGKCASCNEYFDSDKEEE